MNRADYCLKHFKLVYVIISQYLDSLGKIITLRLAAEVRPSTFPCRPYIFVRTPYYTLHRVVIVSCNLYFLLLYVYNWHTERLNYKDKPKAIICLIRIWHIWLIYVYNRLFSIFQILPFKKNSNKKKGFSHAVLSFSFSSNGN